MTAIIDKSMVEGSAYLPSNGRNLDIPQQLLEINELLKSINTRLEDCALEWQAEISQKDLDEAFQHLLSCNKIFTEYFKNFIDLLQDETASDNKETRYTRNQFYDTTRNCKELNNNHTKSMQLLSLNHKHLNEERKIQDYINNISTVQNSFTDVLKAKLNFDTKFLGFEAVLHKATSTSTNIACFCQDCSNTVAFKNIMQEKKKRKTICSNG
ncbi:unnamed protein product [Xylocopa violacea]|uniref:Uncharacterized protein n=1 Tax=Xylocopa violacea TaxID=135666 RepID=A0ABP1P7D9_XYLVO